MICFDLAVLVFVTAMVLAISDQPEYVPFMDELRNFKIQWLLHRAPLKPPKCHVKSEDSSAWTLEPVHRLHLYMTLR